MQFERLREQVETVSAVEAAELFLSPHIREEIFLEALREPGPTLWIVNRSDVADRVLEKLLRHPIGQIAARAAEKFKNRNATITHLSDPIVELPYEQLEHYSVEDLLGHPLCPWDAMMFFSKSASEDFRASTCLSLARRLFEHPKQSLDLPIVKTRLIAAFTPLAMGDPSPMVRSYAARIPIWEPIHIQEFTASESHDRVLAKWFQNDATPVRLVDEYANKNHGDPFLRRVLALDARLEIGTRRNLLTSASDPFERAIHEAYLKLVD